MLIEYDMQTIHFDGLVALVCFDSLFRKWLAYRPMILVEGCIKKNQKPPGGALKGKMLE